MWQVTPGSSVMGLIRSSTRSPFIFVWKKVPIAYRNEAVCKYDIFKSSGTEYDVITAPGPRPVVCHVTLQSSAVVVQSRELQESDEFRHQQLAADHLGHSTTVGNVDAVQQGERPQRVRVYRLRATVQITKILCRVSQTFITLKQSWTDITLTTG